VQIDNPAWGGVATAPHDSIGASPPPPTGQAPVVPQAWDAPQAAGTAPGGTTLPPADGWTFPAARTGPDPIEAAPVGSLGIKDRRAWKSWHVAVFTLVALLLGMFIGNLGSSSASTSSASTKTYTPPPASGSTATTTTLTTATGAGSGTTATTAPATASTTTAPATAAGSGSRQVQVLVPRTQSQGNWTSPSFTISGGTWYVGWAYQCSPAPASGPAFQIFVVPNGGSPSGAGAITSGAASGSAITPQTSPGAQQIIVQAPAGCTWVVKVTGVGTP
jgi:hypothetical protein